MLDLRHSGVQHFALPHGPMEVLIDAACAQPLRGIALIAHPQPLLGGSARHKLPQFLAQALCQAGWSTLRPNFRGVGDSAGQYDHGQGEAQDLYALYQAVRSAQPDLPIALLGISFGAFVQALLAERLQQQGQPAARLVLAAMPCGQVNAQRHYATPDAIGAPLVIHGEHDTSVPLPLVLDWARPRSHPVLVVPGASHLFTGKLPLLRELVLRHLQA